MNFKKNKLLTHKILPIISVLLFCLFNFCIISYGATTYHFSSSVTEGYNINGEYLSFPDISNIDLSMDYDNAFVYKYSNGNVYVVFSYSVFENVYHNVYVSPNFQTAGDKCYFNVGVVPGNYYTNSFNRNFCRYKLVNGVWQFWDKGSSGTMFSGFSLDFIYYCNTDVYDYDSLALKTSTPKLLYSLNNLNKFEITLSTTENTNNPVIAYSNYFNYNDSKKYKCYISTDSQNWSLMNYETFNNTESGDIKFRFNYKIFENGTYYFKLLDTETNEEKYITYVVTNILKNSSNSGYNEYGIPQPFLSYKRVNDEFIIKTQNLTLEDVQKYQCFYIKDSDYVSDYSQWEKMNLATFNNTQLNQTEYYFYIKVPKDSENCIYYFVFYDYKQGKYGSPSSLNCDFAAMNEYFDKVYSVTEEKESRFGELLNFFKDRFGFLTYPFEFIGNLLNRFFTIDFKEPIFYIPDIKEPFTNFKIISAREFNLNSILDNNIFKTIHDYYLLFVDAFVFIGIINLLRLKFKEVSTK